MKRFISLVLSIVMVFSLLPTNNAFAEDKEDIATVENEYIRITVSRENGGYTISTINGDVLRKSDNNKALTHRGENFDTSFTSFQINGDTKQEYVFGNDYGLLGMSSSDVVTEVDSVGITSKWCVNDLEINQRIELVSGVSSEQLGTALISYTVKNNSESSVSLKSRVLMDTQLGANDFGYYEVTKGVLGAGYNFIDKEMILSGTDVPADYFVKDSPYDPDVVAFGVNSTIATDKPYQMAFAHWANIATQKFDYSPDKTLYFTNKMNTHQTADSAVALYYDLELVPAGGQRSFSTFYGVTANLKNADNQVLINTTAPSKLDFNDARNAYIGSSGEDDNLIRINSTISNPILQDKTYKNLAVVIYAIGFTTQRQTDSGRWIEYDNNDPMYSKIVDFVPGENITTFFDFKFEPRDNHELGSFVTKVFNVDSEANELGAYAEEFCLGETINYIFIPAKDPTLPSITLNSMEPKMLYNDQRRYLTVSGRGMSFFQSGLQAVELHNGKKIYQVPIENITIAQDTKSLSILLNEYMEPGVYQLHFLWDGSQPDDIPDDFNSSDMYVHMTSDETYRNDKYGILIVKRGKRNTYEIMAYNDESAFEQGRDLDYTLENLIFVLRGGLIKENDKKEYRIAGKNKDININHILNYRGSDFMVSEKNGAVEILMNGKITTVGANTTVRDGSAAFNLDEGTKYIVPLYNERGEIQTGGTLGDNEEYIELMWNNSMDVLQTIGGFLIDLKYGVLGKIEEDGETYDIISFGGGLDLSFMTPGGARTARANKSENASWDIATLNDKSGLNPIGQPVETEKAPTTNAIYNLEAGVNVHDVLYGQDSNKTGYLGINMDANMQLPQIVSFLPTKMVGSLSINTIGGYEVGVEGEAKAATFEMEFALVIKSNPSGAPIPDKLFFSLGGFEPGINVDGLTIFWLTGGGGGFDNLYETIYGTDGVPPFKLLLNVQFDIFKIMTGEADLGLSLRSLNVELGQVSLKVIKDAKFLEGGSLSLTWYPNFDLSASAKVNYQQIFKGQFSITANQELFEMMLRVAITIPQIIPIVGGMEVAAAELGGGTEKMWGSVELLELIKVGFVYYWDSGNVDFTSNKGAKSRTMAVYNAMTAPKAIGYNSKTGQTQYVAAGSNLEYIAGNVTDQNLTPERIEQLKGTSQLMKTQGLGIASTNIISNTEHDSHLVTLGTPEGDYILTISRSDGKSLGDDFADNIKIWNNGAQYPLKFYQKTGLVGGIEEGESLSDKEKNKITEAAQTANVNIVGNVAYIVVPKIKQLNSMFLVEFLDGEAYDVGAVFVSPISELTSQSSELNGSQLKVKWTGENLSSTAKIKVSVSDEQDNDGIILAENILANDLSAEIIIPETIASGNYTVSLTLVDEEKCYETYPAGNIVITDAKAPTAPMGVSLFNIGNNKLSVIINDSFDKEKLEGYYIDIYEEGKLIEAGVYYDKDQAKEGEILIGGQYDMPVMEKYTDKDGIVKYRQKTYQNGDGVFQTIGFIPGKGYCVKVRAGSSEKVNKVDVYHYSEYIMSNTTELKAATIPKLSITVDKGVAVNTGGIGFATANSTNVFKLTASEPVKGTLTINGASGETYNFDSTYQTTWEKELSLSDGIYSLEFEAEDQDGDKSMYQTSVSVDTTAPIIMLESPINGSIFTKNEIIIKGIADSDAKYTFKIDGVTIGETDREMSAYFTKNALNYTLPLEKVTTKGCTLKIIAKDFVGNLSTRQIELTNENLTDIERVEIYMHGKPVSSEGIRLNSTENTVDLHLMGITGSNQMIDITQERNVSFALTRGEGVKINGNTLVSDGVGKSMILASLDLGGGSVLSDGIMAFSGEEIFYDALDNALAEGKALEKEFYDSVTWNTLKEAIKSGETLRNMSGISQEIINNAATTIVNAIEGLIEKENTTGSSSNRHNSYYIVTFNTSGGSKIDSQKIVKKDKIEKPADPIKAGYIFREWYTDKELKKACDFNTLVTSSFTLYAGWIKNEEYANWENPFIDIHESDWFYEDVKYVCTNKLFSGTSLDIFSPKVHMTRGMLVTVLYRFAESPDVKELENIFNDVDNEKYYMNAVKWAQENGIVDGFGNDMFMPDLKITREQIAVILFRYANIIGKVQEDEKIESIDFADAEQISKWAAKAVKYCSSKGVITGKPGNLFDAHDCASRGEVAAMIHRFLINVK